MFFYCQRSDKDIILLHIIWYFVYIFSNIFAIHQNTTFDLWKSSDNIENLFYDNKY